MMEMGLGFVSESGGSSTDSPTESLNGLKFGQKIYFEDTVTPAGAGAPPKPGASGSGKKPRGGAVAQSGHPPRCQVEGCKADLSDAKAYYSRHKVCGMHSKTPKVIVAGIEQRFCQQCSRFHLLSEFDQGKRSCRRRLAGHNERRRKPPPGSLLPSRYPRLTCSIIENSSRSGGVMVDFSAYPRLAAAGRDSWPLGRPVEHLPVNNSCAIGRAHPHIWQNDSENPPPNILFQSSGSGTSLSDSVLPHGECFTESSRALSLLSNQSPWAPRNRASSIGVNNLISSVGITMAQPTLPPGAATMNTSWGLMKGNDCGNSSGMTPPSMGAGQLSQSVRGQFSDELESVHQRRRHYVELEDPRTYDTSAAQHINWSL